MSARFGSFLLGFLVFGCGQGGAGAGGPDAPASPTTGAEVPPTGDRGLVPRHDLGAMPPWMQVETEAALEHPFPHQHFPHVPGRVVGVLVMTGLQPYGSPIGHGGDAAYDDAETDRDEYRFGFEGSSPYAQYFPSSGEGFNVLRGWSVPIDAERTFRADAAMFDRETPNPFGLRNRAHLVELEVNGGAGGEGIHFIVTGARVLDGTPAFPPRLDALLTALRDDFTAATDDDVRAGLAAFAAAETAHPDVSWQPGRSRTAMHPTYRAADRTIDVAFRRELVRTGAGPVREVVQDCPYCPPGAPCMRCDPHSVRVRDTITLSFVVSGRYVVDRAGRVRDRWRTAGATSQRTVGSSASPYPTRPFAD